MRSECSSQCSAIVSNGSVHGEKFRALHVPMRVRCLYLRWEVSAFRQTRTLDAGVGGRRIWSRRPSPLFACPPKPRHGRGEAPPQADAEFLPPEAVACLLAPSTRSHLRFCIPGWRCRSGRQSKSCPGRNSHSAGIRGYTSGGTSKGGIMRARSSSSSSMTKCCCS